MKTRFAILLGIATHLSLAGSSWAQFSGSGEWEFSYRCVFQGDLGKRQVKEKVRVSISEAAGTITLSPGDPFKPSSGKLITPDGTEGQGMLTTVSCGFDPHSEAPFSSGTFMFSNLGTGRDKVKGLAIVKDESNAFGECKVTGKRLGELTSEPVGCP